MLHTSQLGRFKHGKDDEDLKKILRIHVRNETAKEFVRETEDKLGERR